MTIWGKTDGLLLDRDRFIESGNVTETRKPTKEGDSEVIEMSRLVRVTIRGETDSLLLGHDRFVEIDNVAETLKPKAKGDSEIIETCRLHGMILGYIFIRPT